MPLVNNHPKNKSVRRVPIHIDADAASACEPREIEIAIDAYNGDINAILEILDHLYNEVVLRPTTNKLYVDWLEAVIFKLFQLKSEGKNQVSFFKLPKRKGAPKDITLHERNEVILSLIYAYSMKPERSEAQAVDEVSLFISRSGYEDYKGDLVGDIYRKYYAQSRRGLKNSATNMDIDGFIKVSERMWYKFLKEKALLDAHSRK